VKFDGYRMEALKSGQSVRLLSRNGADYTQRFRPIAEAVAKLNATTALLDGEVVAVDERGKLGLLRFDGQEIGKSCKMKSIKDNPVKIRRKFDQNFKREALQNWFNSGKSAEVIAGELGLNSNLLYAWKKRFAPDGTGQRAPAAAKPGSVADLQAQLDAAHRENRHLREQRDILKKTLGILSEPPASVMNGSTR
jgi:transposase-like protein